MSFLFINICKIKPQIFVLKVQSQKYENSIIWDQNTHQQATACHPAHLPAHGGILLDPPTAGAATTVPRTAPGGTRDVSCS